MGPTGADLWTDAVRSPVTRIAAPEAPRSASPDEPDGVVTVGDFAAFVASDKASAMTGAVVNRSCGSVVDQA